MSRKSREKKERREAVITNQPTIEKSWSWLSLHSKEVYLVLVSGVLSIIAWQFLVIRDNQAEKVKEIFTKVDSLQTKLEATTLALEPLKSIPGSIEKLRDRLNAIEIAIAAKGGFDLQSARARAVSLGFENPRLFPVIALEGASFTESGANYRLTYTVVSLDNNRLVLRFDGFVGGIRLSNNQATMHIEAGKPFRLRQIVSTPDLPDWYITFVHTDLKAPALRPREPIIIVLGTISKPKGEAPS